MNAEKRGFSKPQSYLFYKWAILIFIPNYTSFVSWALFLFIMNIPCCSPYHSRINDMPFFNPGSKMSTEAQRVDDSPSTSGGSSDGDQRESVQQEPDREQVQPKKKEGKISSKTAAKLSTSAKR
jgi:hypothetical protein